METERRVLRSENPSQAIRIFLAKNATEPDVRAAVVSSEDGLLIGGVGDTNLEVLAALASAKDAGNNVAERCKHYGLSAGSIHPQRVRVGDQRFVVASVGAPIEAADGVRALLGRMLS